MNYNLLKLKSNPMVALLWRFNTQALAFSSQPDTLTLLNFPNLEPEKKQFPLKKSSCQTFFIDLYMKKIQYSNNEALEKNAKHEYSNKMGNQNMHHHLIGYFLLQ